MTRSDRSTRVLIALTESSPVDKLWEAALAWLDQSGSDLVALYLAEDHWQRAASLPFTREISRVSGVDVDFTAQRARQVQDESIERTRRLIGKLAADAKLPLGFKVLVQSEQVEIRDLVSGGSDVLIAPSFIIRRPLYDELKKLNCRIELVEVPGNSDTGHRALPGGARPAN